MTTADERLHKRCWWRAARTLIAAHRDEFHGYYTAERQAEEDRQDRKAALAEALKAADG